MDCARSTARAFLAAHTDIAADSDIDVRLWPQTGFSGARIWQVRTHAGTYCLRRWPEQGLPAVRIRALHHFIRDLAARGIDVVAVPLAAEDGSTLLWHDVAWWQLEPWMPGRADYSSVPTDDRLRNIMHAVADIHCAAAQHEPEPDGRDWFAGPGRAPSPNGQERLRLLRHWEDARIAALMQKLSTFPDGDLQTIAAEVLLLYGQLRERVVLQVKNALSRSLPLQVCLRDLWHDHVLLSGENV
ncbi:MAG: phosphotransferase, partial [Maioricimonas sp. JB049]